MHIGMRIPAMGRELGFKGVVQWASEVGLGSIDLPEVNKEMRRICDDAGIGVDFHNAGRPGFVPGSGVGEGFG